MKKFIALVSLFSLILVTPVHASVWDTMLKTINGALGFAISDDNTSRLVIDNTGKVGIGSSSPQATLDVAGNIRVGDTATNCDTNNEGSLRFNSTGNTMEFCNGLTWNKFVLNSNPIATNVGLSGTLTVEQTLTGSYTYFDEENDSEGATSFVWYRADDGLRTNEAVINGVTGTTYTLAMDDVGKFIRFEVTPRATTGALTGSPFSATTPSAITQDTTPDAFAFTDQTSVEPSTLTTSNSLTITGINGEVAVSVSGDGSPQIRIAGGSWATSGTITNGQTLEVRLTSNSGYETASAASITVGSSTDNWTVTTRQEDITPDPFSFTDQPSVELNTLTTSNTVTITGIPSAVSVSVSGDGSPQISINSGGWTTSGTIANNQTLQVRLTSSASYVTLHTATVTVGDTSDAWQVTTRPEVVATGGSVTTYSNYTVHTFTSSGTFQLNTNKSVDALIVAGGGGGGGGCGYYGAGGGAGGMREFSALSLAASSYNITVGAGGSAGGGCSNGGNGGDSSAFGYTSTGGGFGEATGGDGGDGGSGGGGPSNAGSGNTPSVSPSQGNNGGKAHGAGGGGAGGAGESSNGGTGGIGKQSSITGTAIYYAGGGSGGYETRTLGPQGGGGNGGGKDYSRLCSNGENGKGGGGGGHVDNDTPCAGGSGVVIIRYQN